MLTNLLFLIEFKISIRVGKSYGKVKRGLQSNVLINSFKRGILVGKTVTK